MKHIELLNIAATAAFLLFGATTASAGPVYNFTTIDSPAALFGTYLGGINNAGDMVGDASVGASGASLRNSGFLLAGGSFLTINPAGSHSTVLTAINNSGDISGHYESTVCCSTPRVGFGRLASGAVTVIDLAPHVSTTANGINDAGTIVGDAYLAGSPFSGFIKDSSGTHPFNAPGGLSTHIYGINNSGDFVGQAGERGFLDHAGIFSFLDIPGAILTVATALNNDDTVVGYFVDSAGLQHGFKFSGGAYQTLDDPLGLNSYLTGINDRGQIVGNYSDGRVQHGFIAQSVPEPASWAMLLGGLGLLAARRVSRGHQFRYFDGSV